MRALLGFTRKYRLDVSMPPSCDRFAVTSIANRDGNGGLGGEGRGRDSGRGNMVARREEVALCSETSSSALRAGPLEMEDNSVCRCTEATTMATGSTLMG